MRHIESDFIDNWDLIEKVKNHNLNHQRQQNITKALCRSMTSESTVRKLEVLTIILPALGLVFYLIYLITSSIPKFQVISLIVCCTTLFLLQTYFKRSKRVLVYANLIISYILYQTTYVTELIIRLLYKALEHQLTFDYSLAV